MNGKKAKALRKAAQRATVGATNVQYTEGRKNVRLVPGNPDAEGKPTFIEKEITGTVRLIKGCTRSIYHAFKRQFLAA